MREPFDVIVVGSGATGSWVAKELGESGLDVAVLEAGPLFEHARVRTSAEAFSRRYPVQSKMALCNPNTQQLWVDDIDNPYTTPADRPFNWFRSRIVGGRLRLWGRVCLRISDHEFEEADRDGYGPRWPIGHAELAPFYAEIERFLSVTGRAHGLAMLPDGDFVDPVCEACPGYEHLARAVPAKLGRTVIPGRVALRDASAVLNAALATGRVTLRANSIVRRIITNEGRASGIELVDRLSHRNEEVFGKVVVLAASSIESARILFMSEEGGLGNESGVLGRHVMDHLHVSAFGTMTGVKAFADATDVGGRAYIPRFRNIGKSDASFIRGYGIDANVQGMAFGVPNNAPFFALVAMGEMLSRPDNRVTLDPDVTDAWGLPVARIDCSLSDNDRAMVSDMKAQVDEVVAALGFTETTTTKTLDPGSSIHEVGTARMGADRKQSYLDPNSRAWEVKNLYVVDGSAFPTIAWQNSTHTMMALALRAARHIVAEGRRHNL
jgi:choline dehydrogenase-like flavoprotein